MTNLGIDYGNGLTNIDIDNGIRYGVIHQNEVGQAWCDESEPVYGLIDCHKCNKEFDLDTSHFVCPHCNNEDFDFIETETFEFTDSEYQAFSDSQGDIMVTKSPYFTYAQFCSPCAPGAVYLMSPVEPNDNNKGYCFGHDWFEDGRAPYPVYSVETGEIVNP